MRKGNKVQKLIRLNRKNADFAKGTDDPLTRELPSLLAKFSEFPTSISRYDWKTLSDVGFENWCSSLSQEELIQINRTLAAEQGDASAQNNLGFMYNSGFHVQQRTRCPTER